MGICLYDSDEYAHACWKGYMETKGEKQGKFAHSFFHLMKKMLSII